ncbi:MAG: HD domain-containing phosphohydrolase [Thermodesulfobacteriota bacterium]
MQQPRRILVVDDEEPNRELLEALLASLGYRTQMARDGAEALAKLDRGVDLVLLDVMMPDVDGFEVMRRIRAHEQYGDVPVVMVTALTSREDRLRAVVAGANDFVTKPIDRVELQVRVASLLRMKDAQDQVKRHKDELEVLVQNRTAALRKALSKMAEARRRTHEAHLDTIYRLAIAAECKDGDTGAHILRVRRFTALLAGELQLPEEEVEMVSHAAAMHDVGKIGIPDSILRKPGSLDPEEWHVMKRHTTIGGQILSGSSSELLRMGEIIAVSHHEKWDGSGYPHGLKGDRIPLWGRMCAVADVFDALVSDRVYRKRLTNEEAFQILRQNRGTHLDPELVGLFLDHEDEVNTIRQEHSDTSVAVDPECRLAVIP